MSVEEASIIAEENEITTMFETNERDRPHKESVETIKSFGAIASFQRALLLNGYWEKILKIAVFIKLNLLTILISVAKDEHWHEILLIMLQTRIQ